MMNTIKINTMLISGLLISSSISYGGFVSIKDFIPGFLPSNRALDMQTEVLRNCDASDLIVPIVTGLTSAVVYNSYYQRYKKNCDNATVKEANRLEIFEGFLAGIGMSIVKRMVFSFVYGKSGKVDAFNTADTVVTLAAFLSYNKWKNSSKSFNGQE